MFSEVWSVIPPCEYPHVGLPAGPVPMAGVAFPEHLPAMLVGQQGEGFGVHHRRRRGLFPILVDELHHHQPQLPDRFLVQLRPGCSLDSQQEGQPWNGVEVEHGADYSPPSGPRERRRPAIISYDPHRSLPSFRFKPATLIAAISPSSSPKKLSGQLRIFPDSSSWKWP